MSPPPSPPEAGAAAPGAPAGEGGRAQALLRQLEWTVIRRLDGLLQGDYRTLMRGSGLDLADLREYQAHDDVRHIDWNVTARQGVPHVRVFTEDREMAAWFLLDLSPSVDFGSGAQSKRDVAARFTAVVSRLLTRHGNRVGAMLYDRGVEAVVPAGSGRRHVLHLLHQLVRPQAANVGNAGNTAGANPARLPEPGATRLRELLDAAAGLVKRRSTLFVVSDFISEPGWELALARLARRHEVVAVRLFDPIELELPDLGLLTLRDAETGEQLLVDTHDKAFRHRFARIAAQREAQLREGLAAAGVDTLELATDDDLVDALVRFVDLRRRRTRLSGGSLPAHLATRPAAEAA